MVCTHRRLKPSAAPNIPSILEKFRHTPPICALLSGTTAAVAFCHLGNDCVSLLRTLTAWNSATEDEECAGKRSGREAAGQPVQGARGALVQALLYKTAVSQLCVCSTFTLLLRSLLPRGGGDEGRVGLLVVVLSKTVRQCLQSVDSVDLCLQTVDWHSQCAEVNIGGVCM